MEHQLVCKKTFRYYTSGNPQKAKYVLYVLHGYGQLAEFFIKKFEYLNDNYFIVAPEGMHRFYLKGSSGRVGASWMTKEARENDIHDNLNWLSHLQNEILKNNTFEKEIVLGFSQGGATAARWNKINNIHNQIYWASVFPPDINIKNTISQNNKTNNYFALGNQDEYFNEDEQKSIIQFYAKNGFKTYHFNGPHTIDSTTLNSILDDINLNY